MAVTGTTVVRRQLGRRLAAVRKQAGITHEGIEQQLGISRASMYRLERGLVEIKIPTVQALCRLYGLSEEEAESLAAMAPGTKAQGWWQEYGASVPEWFRLYIGLEEGATAISAWDDSLVPGLLQTADYARAVFVAANPGEAGREQAERHVAVRLARQVRILERLKPPRVTTVIGEGALARHVGGRDVMADQLAHLRNLAERPGVEIRVLHFAAGAHPAMTGAFRILDFEDPQDPDVVYVEALAGGRYLEQPDELARYRAAWDLIHQQSVPIGEHT